jgi:hypothetical protein
MVDIAQILLLISFSLLYLTFLFYDFFRREDDYGSIVYVMAILPANYLWYMASVNDWWKFGLTGSMMVLTAMWLFAIIRDIYIKDQAQGYKDYDDIILMVGIGVVINLIASAILPAFKSLEIMQQGTTNMLKFFYFPIVDPTLLGNQFAPSEGIFISYKVLVSLVILSILYPTIIDLQEAQLNWILLIILTILFGFPFLFLAYIWAPQAGGLKWVLLFLFCVLFFMFLLLITRGERK